MQYQENSQKLLIGVTPIEQIETHILNIRGQKVMLDEYLAEIYEVETKVLNQAVKRNIERFPEDFMFQLTENEGVSLRSQSVTSKTGRGGRRYLPYVFTQEGVAMLSSVLNSERAIQVNISIMRAFVKMRSVLTQEKVIANLVSQVVVEVLTETQKRGLFNPNFNASPTNSTSANSSSAINPKLTNEQILEKSQPYYELLDNCSKEIILEALEVCGHNQALTYKYLRMSRSTFYRLLNRYNLNKYTINNNSDIDSDID